jgi:hypothetical protein
MITVRMALMVILVGTTLGTRTSISTVKDRAREGHLAKRQRSQRMGSVFPLDDSRRW